MKLLSKIFSAVPGIALLGALAAGTYYGLKYVVGLFSRIYQQVAIVTAIAGVTLMLSVSIIASGMRWAKERESELNLRVEKNALYKNVLQN